MNSSALPAGYRNVMTLEMKRENKLAVVINALAAAAAIPLMIIGMIISPLSEANSAINSDYAWLVLIKPLFLLVGIAIYTLLREGLHGLLIKYLGGAKPTFGYTGLYIYACNDKGCFNKRTHIIISLAPSVVLFVFLLVLNIILPAFLFWIIYLIQIINITGAVGDIYVAYAAKKMPDDLLVHDTGVAIKFYTKEKVLSPVPEFEFVFTIYEKIRTVYLVKLKKFCKRAAVKLNKTFRSLSENIKKKRGK